MILALLYKLEASIEGVAVVPELGAEALLQ